jgi:hypothetical protein
VEVPNLAATPFDLVVADHASHFRLDDLERVAVAAGFEVLHSTDSMAAEGAHRRGAMDETAIHRDQARRRRRRRGAPGMARRVGSRGPAPRRGHAAGVLDTSIGGGWLWQEVAGDLEFFVDEHAERRTFLDRPMLRPADVPPGATVLLSPPAPMGVRVAERLSRSACTFVAIAADGSPRAFGG